MKGSAALRTLHVLIKQAGVWDVQQTLGFKKLNGRLDTLAAPA